MNQRPVILFDWDGTLADSMNLCVEGVRGALEKLGLPPVSEEMMRSCNGPTFDETIPLLGIPEALAETYKTIRMELELAACPRVNHLFPGIRDMLLRLKERADLCIASNGGAEYLAVCCHVFDLEGVFSRIEAFQQGRVKAQAVAEFLADMNPSFAVMVGDRLGDISAGKANGLKTICCTYGYGTEDEWRQADQSVATVAELEKMLQDLIG